MRTNVSVAESENESARPDPLRELALRLRHEAYPAEDQGGAVASLPGGRAGLAPATQIEIEGSEVQFWVSFSDLPNDHWLRVFGDTLASWPAGLCSPRVEEGRGVWFGPLPIAELDEHVTTLKRAVAETNATYAQVVEPELRRQAVEARRREEERIHLQAAVQARLKDLLG
jgi:hypothetical protein